MPGPGDSLFLALAQAKARPSKAFRAVEAGGQAGEDILGGYLGGKEIGQKLSQYKTLNTRLGDVFPPDQIPGGLSPDHTVGQLMQLAPILPYTRSPMADAIADELSGNSQGLSASSAPSSPPVPAPTIASTSMAPIPGAANPPQTPGATDLASIQGTGAGGGANLPPGTSPTVPSFRGMSYMDLQRYGPLLNDVRQGRQFQQGQRAEESRFQRGQSAEESRFGRGHMATAASEAAKNLATTGTIQDDINTLRNLYKGYEPPAFVGGMGAAISAASGKPNYGTPWMVQGNQIGQVTPGLGAKINYELTHRFSPGESQLLMKFVAPSPTDDEINANRKLDNLQRLTSVFQSSDMNQINMVASAIAGQPIHALVPTSAANQTPTNSAGLGPRIRVRNRQTGQAGTVSVNNYDPNKYQKI